MTRANSFLQMPCPNACIGLVEAKWGIWPKKQSRFGYLFGHGLEFGIKQITKSEKEHVRTSVGDKVFAACNPHPKSREAFGLCRRLPRLPDHSGPDFGPHTNSTYPRGHCDNECSECSETCDNCGECVTRRAVSPSERSAVSTRVSNHQA